MSGRANDTPRADARRGGGGVLVSLELLVRAWRRNEGTET